MKPWGLLLLKLRNMCMLFSVVDGVCGGEVESSFFRLRFSGVASSGAESTSKSDSGELGGPPNILSAYTVYSYILLIITTTTATTTTTKKVHMALILFLLLHFILTVF
uniref:Uncharacterized protein n=1 Tax=Glossina palpalis gambiensis TaxID=67801 RepID=A0A1B0B6S4_9MUSC